MMSSNNGSSLGNECVLKNKVYIYICKRAIKGTLIILINIILVSSIFDIIIKSYIVQNLIAY